MTFIISSTDYLYVSVVCRHIVDSDRLDIVMFYRMNLIDAIHIDQL